MVARLLCLFLIVGALDAQVIRRLSIEDGLSQSSINTLLQDQRGFMWFGTQDGLNRYDGHGFKVYRKRRDQSSLSDSWIRALFEDDAGYIWVGTHTGGLNRFDPRTESFVHFRHRAEDFTSLSHDKVMAITRDRQGQLWVGTEVGLNLLDEAKGSFERYEVRASQGGILPEPVRCLAVGRDDQLWVGTALGLFRFDVTQRVWSDQPMIDQRIRCLSRDAQGTLWAGTDQGLCRIEDGRVTHFPLRIDGRDAPLAVQVNGYLEVSPGIFWVITVNNGLLEFEPDSGSVKAVAYDSGRPESGGLTLLTLFQDRSGLVWVGTHGNGIYQLHSLTGGFATLRRAPGAESGMLDNIVFQLAEDHQGTVWFGTVNGLHYIDRTTGRAVALPELPLDDGSSLSHYTILGMSRGAPGTLWLGLFRYGVFRFDIASRTARHIPEVSKKIDGAIVYDLLWEEDNSLWVGTEARGLWRYRPGEPLRHYSRDVAGPGRINHNSASCIYRDSKERLWVGTIGAGLNLFLPDQDAFTAFSRIPDDPQSLSHDKVNSVKEDARGNLWVCTHYGLNRWLGEGNRFESFFEEDGLPNNVVYAVLPEKNGRIWVSTNQGLSRFDLDHDSFYNYDVRDGLQSNEFNTGAALIDHEGVFYFGGVNGLNHFNPSSLREPDPLPPVLLTSVQIMGRPAPLHADPVYLERLTLAPGQNVFSLGYAVPDYRTAHKNTYAVKLEGFNSDWMDLGNRRFFTYTNLDPGDYVFRVKAANATGAWGETQLRLPITVQPAWWQQIWFRFSLVVLFVGLLVFLYRTRVRHLLQIERLRGRIAQDLHDDVGATLTNITVLAELVRQGLDRDGREGYLHQIETMSRELVTTMSDIVWSVDSRYDSMDDLITRMRQFATGILGQLDYEFSVDGLDGNRGLQPAYRHNLYLVFKEALSNCVKHSGASSVRIHFSRQEGKLRLQVEDNGCGLPEVRLPGNGLRNMMARAKAIGGELSYHNQDGFKLELVLPY